MKTNITQLPRFGQLTDNQRWHAGYLARQIDDSALLTEWRPGCVPCCRFRHTEDLDALRIQWTHEALLTAITHHDGVVAFRAFIQAAEYIKVLDIYHLNDTKEVARARIEGILERAS
jgi:hypothetical protein